MSTPCLFPPSSHLPGIARLKVREAKPFATGPTAGQLQWISSAREVHQKRMGRWDGLRKVEIMDLVGGALEPWNYIWLLMVNIIYNQLFWIGKSTIIITGWWWLEPWNFMTFHILGIIIIPTDELIFFGGVETTNQWTKGGIFTSLWDYGTIKIRFMTHWQPPKITTLRVLSLSRTTMIGYTLQQSNVAIEQPPFVDGFPSELNLHG